MEVLRNGKFSITLTSSMLARGLRKSEKNPRDVHSMTELSGMVGQDGILTSLPSLSRIDTSIITDPFPYPQIFVFANYILICDSTKIYDYSTGSMVLKYIASTAGSTWKGIDFIEFLMLTNGIDMVIRDASTGEFTESDTIPAGNAMCNYNSQVIIGGPETPWNIGD